MGTFFHPITIIGPNGEETVEALVDTGASFTTMPASLLRRLGVTPHRRVRLRLADGTPREWDLGRMINRIDDEEEDSLAIFGEEGAPPAIGAYTLEGLSLGIDPLEERLIPREGFLMAKYGEITTLASDKPFIVSADFQLTGDQPEAVAGLEEGLQKGYKHQTLLGVTGSGKTFTMANVIARIQRPTLVMAPNRTLAAQLYSEFRDFFPENGIEYFVSYYDYYQPEAYIPRTDTYIAKDADINEEIDKLRHAATRSLFERRDVVIVASVSCIYGLGEPERVLQLRAEVQGRRYGEPDTGAAAARRHAVRAQRQEPRPRQLPPARRQPDDPPGLRRAGRPHRLLRRRGGAHHGARPAHRRGALRDGRDRHLPREALRDVEGQARPPRSTTSKRSSPSATSGSRSTASCWKRSGSTSARATTSNACASRDTAPASRTTRGTWPAEGPGARRGRCSTTSRTTS